MTRSHWEATRPRCLAKLKVFGVRPSVMLPSFGDISTFIQMALRATSAYLNTFVHELNHAHDRTLLGSQCLRLYGPPWWLGPAAADRFGAARGGRLEGWFEPGVSAVPILAEVAAARRYGAPPLGRAYAALRLQKWAFSSRAPRELVPLTEDGLVATRSFPPTMLSAWLRVLTNAVATAQRCHDPEAATCGVCQRPRGYSISQAYSCDSLWRLADGRLATGTHRRSRGSPRVC